MDLYPGYTIYSLRIDCSQNEHNETEIQKLLDNYEIEFYLFGKELSDKLKKPHYQGIVWKKTEMEKKALNKFRAHIKNKMCDLPDEYYEGTKKQTFSFKKATKPDSLIKYCTKDGDIFSNVSTEKRELIEEWVPKDEFKNKKQYAKKKELLSRIEALPKKYRYDWLHEVIQLNVEIMGSLPRASTLDYYQYTYWLTNAEKRALWLEQKYSHIFGIAKEEKQNGEYCGYNPYPESDGEEEYTEKTELTDYYQSNNN